MDFIAIIIHTRSDTAAALMRFILMYHQKLILFIIIALSTFYDPFNHYIFPKKLLKLGSGDFTGNITYSLVLSHQS